MKKREAGMMSEGTMTEQPKQPPLNYERILDLKNRSVISLDSDQLTHEQRRIARTVKRLAGELLDERECNREQL